MKYTEKTKQYLLLMNNEQTEEIIQKAENLLDQMNSEEIEFIESYMSKRNQVFLNQIRRIIL